MRPYDHLFFDLDNTLWDFATNSRLAMEQTLEQTELILKLSSFDTYFEVYEQINQALWSDYHAKKINKQKLITERFSRSFQAHGIDNYDWTSTLCLYLFRSLRRSRHGAKRKGRSCHQNGSTDICHRYRLRRFAHTRGY